MNDQSSVRSHLIDQIEGNNAHIGFQQAVEGLSWKETGNKPEDVPYSIWQLVDHLRIAQEDILDFSRNSDYTALQWPDDYWPATEYPQSETEWEQCLEQISRDQKQMVQLLRDSSNDLFQPMPWGDGQTLFREAVLIVDHNAYHIGQIVLLRKLLGLWE